MAEGTCKDCRSWEEEMYWTHFESFHFSQVLEAGFDQHLAIPEKYIGNLKRKLPDVATLTGPSGREWKVRVTSADGTTFFDEGWPEFVKENSLEENDFLVFMSNGEGCFRVLIFEGKSMCEKAAAYFVRKCGHTDCDIRNGRKVLENSVENTPDSPENIVYQRRVLRPRGRCGLRSISRVINDTITKRAQRNIRLNRPAGAGKVAEKLDDSESLNNRDPNQIVKKYRRRATENEKQKALQLAVAAVSDDGFVVVMKPTHVYKRYFLSIPVGWMARHLQFLEAEDFILRINENQWRMKFLATRSPTIGGLSLGWKNFVEDNKLQEFDVCVFEPDAHADSSFVLEVKIFRAVEDAATGTSTPPAEASRCQETITKFRTLL